MKIYQGNGWAAADLGRAYPMPDCELQKLGAALKSVRFHHLIFVKLDRARGNGERARNFLG